MKPRSAFIGVTIALAVGSVLAVVLHNTAPPRRLPEGQAKQLAALWELLNTSLGIWATTDEKRKLYIKSVNGRTLFSNSSDGPEKYNEIVRAARAMGFQQ